MKAMAALKHNGLVTGILLDDADSTLFVAMGVDHPLRKLLL